MDPVFQQNVSISFAQRMSPPSVTEKPNLDGRKTFYMSGEDVKFDIQPGQNFINEVAPVQSYDFETSVSFQNKAPASPPQDNAKLSGLKNRAEQLSHELDRLPNKNKGSVRRQRLETALVQVDSQIKTINSKQNVSEAAALAIDSIEYYSRVSENDYMNDDDKPMLSADKGMQLMYIGLIGMGQDDAKLEKAIALFNKLAENPQADLNQNELKLLEELGLRKNESGQLINYGSGEAFKASDAKDALGIMDYQKGLKSINSDFAAQAKSKKAVGSVRNMIDMTKKSRLHFSNEIQRLENQQGLLQNRMNDLSVKKEKAVTAVNNLQNRRGSLNTRVASVESWLQKFGQISSPEQLMKMAQNNPEIRAFLQKEGIEIQSVNGQYSLMKNGQELSGADGLSLLSSKGKEMLSGLQAERAELEHDLSHAQEQLEQTQTAMTDLENQLEDVKDQKNKVVEAGSDYRANIAEMRALRNDPERWAALSAEEQQLILEELDLSGPLLERSRAVIESVDQDINAASELLAETRTFIQEAEGIIAEVEQLLAFIQALELKMGMAIEIIDRVIQSSEANSIAQTVNELVARANELGSKLVLTPDVKQVDVNELIQEWQDILKETAKTYNDWDKELSADLQIERRRMQAYAEKLLDDVNYQMDYVKNMSEHREEKQRAYLQSVVPELQLSLSA